MNGRIITKRLRQGQDLLEEIVAIAKAKKLEGAVVLSAVGCVSKYRVRDASGTNYQEETKDCEIISLQGTVSELRTHLHISFSKEDLSVIGGHLAKGCIINTTCELVLMELPGISYGVEKDAETGYDEILFHNR